MVNTVIFSIYDCGCRSSALLLSDGTDLGAFDQTMYKEQIPYADEIADYSDKKLFAFFSQMFDAEIGRVVIVIDGKVYRIWYPLSERIFRVWNGRRESSGTD